MSKNARIKATGLAALSRQVPLDGDEKTRQESRDALLEANAHSTVYVGDEIASLRKEIQSYASLVQNMLEYTKDEIKDSRHNRILDELRYMRDYESAPRMFGAPSEHTSLVYRPVILVDGEKVQYLYARRTNSSSFGVGVTGWAFVGFPGRTTTHKTEVDWVSYN